MITELIEYFITPCSWTLRQIGYLRGQLGIKARHRQCRNAWKPHLERTKQAIMTAATNCERKHKAVILGSGLLLDVPIRLLSKEFQEVVLVDVVHPPRVHLTAWWYGNVKLVRADVTETAEQLTQAARRPEMKLPRSSPSLFRDDPSIDFVVSVNLLSQLPYLPSIFLERNSQRPEAETDAFARDLITSHLDYLRSLPGIVTLITDVEKLQINKLGKVVESFDILYGIKVPRPDDEWTWALVPLKHVSPDFAYHRRVVAIYDLKQVDVS